MSKQGITRVDSVPLLHVLFVLDHKSTFFTDLTREPVCQRLVLICRRCEMTLSNQSKMISCVKWGGDGRILSSSRDRTISVWDSKDGRLVARLQGHAHWVNTLALSTDYLLRTGPFDHTGKAPTGDEEARKVCSLLGTGYCCVNMPLVKPKISALVSLSS